MSKHILEGDSSRRHTVLFDMNNLPTAYVPVIIERMAQAHTLIHMPDNATGGLMHLYLEEDIPASLLQYCQPADGIHKNLQIPSGQLTFGGIESVSTDSDNAHLRTTLTIPPGSYQATIYTTIFPAQTQKQTIDAALGKNCMRCENTYTALLTCGGAITFLCALLIIHNLYKTGPGYMWPVLMGATIAGLALLACGLLYGKQHQIKQLRQQLKTFYYENFPSLVVTMKRQ